MAPLSPTHTIPVVRFACIDSTSAYARREASAGRLCRHPIAFVAQRQTTGVGRFGRRWESPIGGVWMTLTWPMSAAERDDVLAGLGIRIGVACRRIVDRVLSDAGCAAAVKLKWPNDVLVDGRKVLGVLTEVVPRGRESWVFVGVGINANLDVAELPGSVSGTATTLRAVIQQDHRRDACATQASATQTNATRSSDVDLDQIIAMTLTELQSVLSLRGLNTEILHEACTHLFGVNESARISMPDNTELRGTLRGLDDTGTAIFEVDGKPFTPPLGASIMLG